MSAKENGIYLHLYGSSKFQLERLESVEDGLRVWTDVYFQLCSTTATVAHHHANVR